MTEAEYVVVSDAAKEALWLGPLAHRFRQVDSDSAPVVHNDSESVVALSKNPVHHNASKHIEVRYHFARDCVISGKIGLQKISTTDNVADGMTKWNEPSFESIERAVGIMFDFVDPSATYFFLVRHVGDEIPCLVFA